MLRTDVYGNTMPISLFHMGEGIEEGCLVRPASESSWWYAMDHDEFVNADPCEIEDSDERAELDFRIRTAYNNIVFEGLSNSPDPDVRAVAENAGLSGLGQSVGIVFVSDDERYVAATYEGHLFRLDPSSDAVLAVIPDENTSKAASWIVVLKPGHPLPLVQMPAHDDGVGGPGPT